MLLALKRLMMGLALYSASSMSIAQTQQIFQDWRLSCDDQQCIATQQLADTNQNTKYTGMISKVKGSDALIFRLIFPLGVYLPPGVSVDIGSFRNTFPMTVCIPNGCSVLIPIDKALKDELFSNKTLKVRFFFSKEQENEIQFSTLGIESVMDLILKKSAD
jgi:invasion protein IalB